MERIETINLKTETDALEAGHGITYDELRGADMLANARKRLEKRNAPARHRTGRRTGRQGR